MKLPFPPKDVFIISYADDYSVISFGVNIDEKCLPTEMESFGYQQLNPLGLCLSLNKVLDISYENIYISKVQNQKLLRIISFTILRTSSSLRWDIRIRSLRNLYHLGYEQGAFYSDVQNN